jgi:hypothetical protein
MKFTSTLAVLALINNVSAVLIRDDEDLFTDNADEQETLNSIAQAEKAHGTKFNGITKEDENALTTQKTKMNFKDDQFLMNERRTYGAADKTLPKGALLMLNDNVYPEPRPIGELMMQISHYTPADFDTKILAGA